MQLLVSNTEKNDQDETEFQINCWMKSCDVASKSLVVDSCSIELCSVHKSLSCTSCITLPFSYTFGTWHPSFFASISLDFFITSPTLDDFIDQECVFFLSFWAIILHILYVALRCRYSLKSITHCVVIFLSFGVDTTTNIFGFYFTCLLDYSEKYLSFVFCSVAVV